MKGIEITVLCVDRALHACYCLCTFFSASQSLAQDPRRGEGWVITGGNCITLPHVLRFALLELPSSRRHQLRLLSLLSRQGVAY